MKIIDVTIYKTKSIILERRMKRVLKKLNDLEKDNKFLLDENQMLKTKIREYEVKKIKKQHKKQERKPKNEI